VADPGIAGGGVWSLPQLNMGVNDTHNQLVLYVMLHVMLLSYVIKYLAAYLWKPIKAFIKMYLSQWRSLPCSKILSYLVKVLMLLRQLRLDFFWCILALLTGIKHKLAALPDKELAGLGTRNFYFQDRKNLKFQDIFQAQSQKRVFVISGAYNFGMFRAEAKITIWRHEVVYRLSSERKMIDLEWPLHAIFMLKSGTTLLSLSCVTYS